MRGVLDRMARAGRPPLNLLTPAQARAAYEAGAGVLEDPRQELKRVQDIQLPVRDGSLLHARLYADALQGPLPVLVYFHGGGFMIGSVQTHDQLCRSLCHLAHCAVLSVDYRLAPEHRFPIAAHDAMDAMDWVRQHGAEWGLDPGRMAVGGDSAGGTLAAVCALDAAQRALPLRLQMLFYPGCAARADTTSSRLYAQGFALDATLIEWFFSHYLRSEEDRHDWRFAPLEAADVDGVAPAWMGLAECDPLCDEGLAYADKLRHAGVAVDLEVYAGVVHEFIKMGRAIPEARRARMDAARALRQAFEETGT